MVKPIKKEMEKRNQNKVKTKTSFWSILPFIITAILFGLILAFQTGLLDINEFKEFFGFLDNNNNFPGKCAVKSCDTGVCCHDTNYDPSIRTNVSVFAVIVPASCPCPEDTKLEPVGVDNTAPGGPYNICECLEQPK